ncbi:hypothetical protein Poli38472_012684 [Pythium oligandrum]|uniref:Uncharacterized protein n=1 Tax=Pythium oligandrum TaxID=41045 RepID=A0A8K1CFA7_PYTOL|nr:hypothetical protein Poli38472_012684 [Pythium oligandrum]|eukprot:TMW61493.1 hypothetical protein Poli38472_012684 [Pythium oligandrum]
MMDTCENMMTGNEKEPLQEPQTDAYAEEEEEMADESWRELLPEDLAKRTVIVMRRRIERHEETTTVEDDDVDEEDNEGITGPLMWLESKAGPWVTRHRSALRLLTFSTLAGYVVIFVYIVVRDGVLGLGERSVATATRDFVWSLLLGLFVLLAVGKHQ